MSTAQNYTIRIPGENFDRFRQKCNEITWGAFFERKRREQIGIDVDQSLGRFIFRFREKDTNVEIARIDASLGQYDIITVFIAWRSETSALAKGFMLWLWAEYRDIQFPDWLVEKKSAESAHKHAALPSNQWLAEQYFDKGRTNYNDLIDEWLKIRERECKPVPSKPIDSMRTFINEEKKRRGIGA